MWLEKYDGKKLKEGRAKAKVVQFFQKYLSLIVSKALERDYYIVKLAVNSLVQFSCS